MKRFIKWIKGVGIFGVLLSIAGTALILFIGLLLWASLQDIQSMKQPTEKMDQDYVEVWSRGTVEKVYRFDDLERHTTCYIYKGNNSRSGIHCVVNKGGIF